MRHHDAETREKRRRTGTVRQRREGAPHVFLAHGEPGAERVRIHADALELAKQLLEPLRLDIPPPFEDDKGMRHSGITRYDEPAEQTAYPAASSEARVRF